MGLVGQQNSKYLKDFIDAALQLHIVLHYRHEAISDYGTIDLDADGILGRAPELLDSQVLLDPFEEQLHTPSVTVKLGDCFGGCRQIVGQKYVSGAVLRVDTDYLPKLFGIILRAFINREVADRVGDNVRRKPPFPGLGSESDIGFRSDDKERADTMDGVQIAEIVVATVEDVMGAVLIRNLRHSLRIVDFRLGNMHKCRNLSLNIVKRVHLDAALMLAELSPLEHRQKQVDGS